MIRSKKSKRRAPKHATGKRDPKATAGSSAESLYGSLLTTVAPSELGLAPKFNLPGIGQEDAEEVRRNREQQELEIEIGAKISRLRDIQPRAMAEVRRLKVNEKRLVVHLWGTWFACRKKTKKLSAVPGVPLRQIKHLPNLLRRVARQVEMTNKHGYSLTVNQMLMLMASSRLRARYMVGKDLPIFLRAYARDLELRLRYRNAGAVEPGTEWKVQTVEFVRETSKDKGQHYEVIAHLMNAFNKMEDQNEGSASKTVTPAALKQLWLAHPPLRKSAAPSESPAVEPIGGKILPSLGKLN